MNRLLIAMFALFLAAPPAWAQTVDKLEVLEFGLYERGAVVDTAPPTANSFGRFVARDLKHLRTTRRIPGRLGVTFGFRYRVVGRPTGAELPVTQVLLLPAPGAKAPQGREPFTRDISEGNLVIGMTGREMMSFDELWEIVPGIWTIQIWQGRRKLLEQHFEVYIPPVS